jgi:hypothetical protein
MPTVDANLLVDDNGVTRPLRVSDLADAVLGVKLDALLAELVQKVEPGQAVALDAPTLAALETIQVGNQPADPATQTTLEAVRLLLAGDACRRAEHRRRRRHRHSPWAARRSPPGHGRSPSARASPASGCRSPR